MEPEPVYSIFVCGKCGYEHVLHLREATLIKCQRDNCGYRTLYKKRTRRIVEHVAR